MFRKGECKLGLKNAKDGQLLYHLTELDNLESIVKNGLQSRRELKKNGKKFVDVADSNIISERQGLGLDKYIPFHFHPYSAFDVAVKNQHAQERMIYICIKRKFAQENQFMILPKHPLSGEKCVLYEFDEGMAKIDWDILMEVGSNEENAKNIKMAEALSSQTIWVKEFHSIAVATDEDKEIVNDILRRCCVDFPPPHVNVQPVWF